MPEIWLRYGTTDVVLDIKFENISSQISSSFGAMQEEQLVAALSKVPLTDNMLVLALSGSKAVAKVVVMLADAAKRKGFNFTIDVPQKTASALRASLVTIAGESETVSINRIDYRSLKERISKFQNTIIVSSVAYDPLFGFTGAPTMLLRTLIADKMAEAFKARQGNSPAPGIEGKPLKIAISAVEDIRATSVEIIANSSKGIAGIHTGSIVEAFNKAIDQFKSISAIEADPVKCAIISASSEAGIHSNLASSLNSLWNSIHIVREGGSAILIAENREGLGGGALQMFIEGRLKPEQLYHIEYTDGLEHLVYIQELQQKYEIGLLSTIPHYYAKTKLGFTTYTGMKDITSKMIEKQGKNFRALILSDADITLLRPKAV
jgi:nickel-dependent lactate racemase